MPRSKKEGDAEQSASPLDVARDIVHVAALEVTMVCMPRSLFEQIRRPDIESVEEVEARDERAQAAAIGYVVARDPGLPRSGGMLWIIVSDRGQLWRWNIGDQVDYDAVCVAHPWFAELPQVFLT